MNAGPRGTRWPRPARVPAVAAAAVGLFLAGGCERNPDPGWVLTWSDEFEGPAGQLPDPANWAFDIGTDWGNNQLEWDTDRPENVSLDGEGRLAITAREEAYEGQPYTSGRIKTSGLFEQQEGRFEARIKLPTGAGIWPAFWMLGNDFEEIGWPQCGEIDIMEYRGQEPTVVLGSIHGPGYSGAASLTGRYDLVGGRFDTEFHTFAVEWTRESITWFVDDTAYHRVRPPDVDGEWVYDHPFFILLNVAVGGGFVGTPTDATTFPQTMLVDWVRVYGRP